MQAPVPVFHAELTVVVLFRTINLRCAYRKLVVPKYQARILYEYGIAYMCIPDTHLDVKSVKLKLIRTRKYGVHM